MIMLQNLILKKCKGWKKLASAALAILFIIPQTACGKREIEPVTLQNFYLDTICSITVYNMEEMSEENATAAIRNAFSLCGEYEKILSKTVEGSDVYNINHAKGEPVEVSDVTIEILKKGLYYGELSEGKFDITIGRAVELWGFNTEDAAVPDPEKLAEVMKCVDYSQIQIEGNTVTMGTKEGEIDLGGIAKGYIADRIAEDLKENGVSSAIISLGGNIETVGGKESNVSKASADFNIGIEVPYSGMTEVAGKTTVHDATVVTSGIYERYFEQDGRQYHHILDPATGYPAESDVCGVTIVSKAGNSDDCDALATICLLKGIEEGKKLIESLDGYEALFIDKNQNITMTDGFVFIEM